MRMAVEHRRIWETTACWAHLSPATVHHPGRGHTPPTQQRAVTAVPLHRESAKGKLTGTESYQKPEKGNLYPGTCSHLPLDRGCLQDAVPTPPPLPASFPGQPTVTHYPFRSKNTLGPKPLLVFLSNQIFKVVCMEEKPRKIFLVLHIQEASTALIAGACE